MSARSPERCSATSAGASPQFVVQASRWTEEDGHQLNDHQKEQVLRALFASVDGLEAGTVKTLISELENSGVKTWGLSSSLEDFVRKSH